MPGPVRSLVRVLASVVVLSLALVFIETTAANGAGTWGGPVRIDQSADGFGNVLTSVSCPSAGFCVAVDNAGNAVTYNGSSWSSPSNIDGSSSINSVSCPSATFCVAVDNAGNALTYNGSSWSSPSNIDGSSTINSVSCPSAGFCVAVDNAGSALTYNGSSWSSPSNIDGNSASHLTSVSCATASFCAAVGNYYNEPTYYYSALVYNGSSWSSPSNFVSPNGNDSSIDSVSCPSAGFCLAVDDGTHSLIYDGSSWSSPPSDNDQVYLLSVSCPSATFCAAVSEAGHAYNYNGSSWSSAVDIDGYTSLDSVSCPSAYFCVAVDSDGDALTYLSTPNPPTVTSVSPHTGSTSGGTLITITGTNFVTGSSVKIGSGSRAVPAGGVDVVSSTKITADTGRSPQAGLFNLFVTSSGVTSAVSAGDLFTYVPTVTSVHPHTGPTSGGTAVTVTGTGFVTGARVVIAQGDGSGTGAIAATNVDVVSSTKITATTGGGAKAGSFNLFVTSSGVTSAADAGDLFTYG